MSSALEKGTKQARTNRGKSMKAVFLTVRAGIENILLDRCDAEYNLFLQNERVGAHPLADYVLYRTKIMKAVLFCNRSYVSSKVTYGIPAVMQCFYELS